jgi:VWFA-related protein
VKYWLHLAALLSVMQAQDPLPRFRSGANLVTVDAYISREGVAVTDLKQAEIELFEDNTPQTIETLRLIRGAQGAQGAQGARGAQGAAGASRTFVIFFDTWHVSSDGARRGAAPVAELLNRVVGLDDRVGVMTPDAPARNMALSTRTAAIDRVVRETTDWGQRDAIDTADPREREIDLCYPESPQTPQYRGIAKEMIERRREQKTLRALNDLIAHLGTQGDERKFVILLTEGWVLFRQDETLARVVDRASVPGYEPAVPKGSPTVRKPDAYDRGFASCERERSLLAFVDHNLEVRQMAQRANRANVTFYAIDPRGLTSFDETIGPLGPASVAEDRAKLASRQGGLRELAGNTDGAVLLNTNDVKAGVARIMADRSSYYVMQYYSTNTKLDGRFRSVAVHVKRPRLQVRARNGYLAPTAEEARLGPNVPPSLPAGVTPITRRKQMTALRRGPSTGREYVKVDQPQFRRTERLRVEMVLPAGATNVHGQILTGQEQPLPLPVTYSMAKAGGEAYGILDVVLAPLAPAGYVLRWSYEVNGKTESADYQFRIVP